MRSLLQQGIIGQNGAFEKKADWNKLFPIE